MRKLWARWPGWEFEVLLLLPPQLADEVWGRAWRQVRWTTWKSLPLELYGPFYGLFFFLMLCGALFGLFQLGPAQVAIDFLFAHISYRFILNRFVPPAVRPFLQDELFLLIEERLGPDHAARREGRKQDRRLQPPHELADALL